MNTKQSKKGHLDAAASHHEQAARFHREASQYYEAGKDYDHAAHQAVLAQGHALFAIDESNLAAKHTGAPLPPGSIDSGLTAARHHAAASDLHGQAAQHLRRAAKLFDDDRSAVAHETQLGFSLASRALAHGNEAARQYVASLREKGV
ncbi:hypothetical protein RI103_20590 [Paraburkholderia sp. FT54]|uniref:hypothetical protein n=1 Tax=Paraburkholderia sp. FT54 TaxID=3074437 RepID=UPI0028772819|nr:hypothetical protein [Paraburkholderia sp. FT54]WNC93216.1 hypothetical protein RI103_20590 [Paraburkholderia sp. FT54]